jgi:hypothetical protein
VLVMALTLEFRPDNSCARHHDLVIIAQIGVRTYACSRPSPNPSDRPSLGPAAPAGPKRPALFKFIAPRVFLLGHPCCPHLQPHLLKQIRSEGPVPFALPAAGLPVARRMRLGWLEPHSSLRRENCS